MRRVVEDGEAVIVARDGKPQVVVLSTAEYERMKRLGPKDDWRQALADAAHLGAEIQARRGGNPLPPPADVLRELREERDEQLLGLR